MITLDQLSVDIDGPRLGPLTLTIADYEHVAVVGPSGAGKSLLVECIAGVRVPTSGRILFDNDDVTERPAWQRGAAWVPQSHGLFPHLSVYENIAYGLRSLGRPHQAAVAAIADALGVTDLLAREPTTLSGGERSRVALGRALALKPKLLVLDEPFGALDLENRTRAWKLVRQLHARGETTIVHVTHELDEVRESGIRTIALHRMAAH